jgi:putative SOS response-associated peptidase YedK
MCGRFVSTSRPDELARYFDAEVSAERLLPGGGPTGEPSDGTGGDPPGTAPWANYNVAPTSQVLVVVGGARGRRIDRFRWGLVPSWAKDPSVGSRMINARAETVAEKPAFRAAYRKRRCIVPADGFYEWQVVPGRRTKQPMYVHRRDGDRLAFAGLWEAWYPPEGAEPLLSCTVVTGRPNEVVAPIHDRMPVVLPPDAWDLWLDPEVSDRAELDRLLVPAPAALFVADPVSTAVNNVRNKGPELVERIDPDAAPGVGPEGEGA